MANSSLDALNFLKTLCKDENGARQVFGDVFAQMFIRILQSSSTDERIHQQILSIFVTATKHNSISIFLAVKTRVPHCLLKFAEEVQDDKLKQLSMSSLENISVRVAVIYSINCWSLKSLQSLTKPLFYAFSLSVYQ